MPKKPIKKTTKKRVVKKPRISKTEKPFADGTMTSSAFFGSIRSALRRKSMFYLPIRNAKERAKIPYIGANKKRKWMYVCEECGVATEGTSCAVHHDPEVGSLKCFEDLPGFVERLFCNSDALKLICNTCHDRFHNKNQEL